MVSNDVAESINQSTDCRRFQPRRPSSAAYKTENVQLHRLWLVGKLIHTGEAFNSGYYSRHNTAQYSTTKRQRQEKMVQGRRTFSISVIIQ